MGLRFISDGEHTALYDSVTDWAFGPVFTTEDAALAFLNWAENHGVPDGDVRCLSNERLAALWDSYCETTEDPGGT